MNQTTNYQLNQWEPGDRVTRADFNADNARLDAALGDLQTAVAGAAQVVFGMYSGNNEYPRTIELGFQPKAVLLINSNGKIVDGSYVFGGLFGPGYGAPNAHVSENGFTLTGNYSNGSAHRYYYLAFK